ncbi:MAG: cytochrome oxidase assembly protein [Chloroflexi bacterium HGW-Chloroflexi-3]|nr:MAG: cytochrome oxidase assembly protein [Chloroflexi bacterium HGW-Chloroflexi-3]
MSLRKFSFFVLIDNVFVILIGALVRATGSGAGCGSHWPSCNGEVIPTSPQLETLIEFSHRITSGLTLIFVLILFIWVFRMYGKKSKIRTAVLFVLIFIIFEALIGAGLVLFELTGENSSLTRAIVIALHLVNTFLLLGSNALLYEWIRDGEPKKLLINRNARQLFILIFVLFLLLGASGAITALGDTLFPAGTLTEGIKQDFSGENFLLQLRVYHPIIAVFIGLGLYFIYNNFLKKSKNEKLNNYSRYLAGLFLIQLIIGVFNVLLLAPIWIQVIHLLLADIVWIIFVLWINQIVFYGLSASSLGKPSYP